MRIIYGAGCWCRIWERFVLPVICLAAIPATALAQDQETSRRPLIEYVTASPSRGPGTNSVSRSQNSSMAADDAPVPSIRAPQMSSTSGDRWEKFEAEFGIPCKDPSLIKGSMESAKYRVDRTLLGMQEIVQDVQKAVSFDYELRRLSHPSSSTNRLTASSVPIPLWDTMEKARFRSDIDLNMAAGRAFVGVQLVLPVGN